MADTQALPSSLCPASSSHCWARHHRQARPREYIILGLFQEAHISGGKAAELLDLNRRDFIALLARKGIPYFRLEREEWDAEAARIRASQQSPGCGAGSHVGWLAE